MLCRITRTCLFYILLGWWKFGHSSRCGGFPFHCWLDCFANFVKIIVRLVPSGERLSICWVGGGADSVKRV